MKSLSILNMFFFGALALSFFLSICAAVMPKPARIQKNIEQHHLTEHASSFTAQPPVPSTFLTSTLTIKIDIPSATSTPSPSSATSSISQRITEKSLALLALQREFTLNNTTHNTFLRSKLALINSTLSSIAIAISVSHATDADVQVLQKLMFSSKGSRKLLQYLEERAGDSQQIDFTAITESIKNVVETVKEMDG